MGILDRSRQMRDGKRGAAPVSEILELEDFTMTYNSDGDVETLPKIHTQADGTQWRKVMTFSYFSPGVIASKTETLELIS